MQIQTFRADTIQEAMALVRHELGPSAAVLHTREVPSSGLLGRFTRRREIEVTASTAVNVPSRMARILPADESDAAEKVVSSQPSALDLAGPNSAPAANSGNGRLASAAETIVQHAEEPSFGEQEQLKQQLASLQDMVENLVRKFPHQGDNELPSDLFRLYTELIDVEMPEDVARGFVDRLRTSSHSPNGDDPLLLKVHVAEMLQSEIQACGPIQVREAGRRVVALVGPTGVGKTTTIAKLAANFRLREKRNVGLITVDTYRIAAVEQLRTYADIIDLPMQVVSTPREMRQAVAQFADLDLVLVDTAGRSPRDEVKIQELRALLAEAQADEVHLVLSSVAGAGTLEKIAQRFSVVGTSALLLTKLDESSNLGNVLPVLRSSKLPLSYLTNGQNVPDDIEAANPAKLSREILGLSDEAAYGRS